MSDQSGIILQKKIKAEISPQIGEIQYVTDTKELAVNSSGQIKYRNNSIVDYRVLKGTTAPDNSLGLDGDFYIRENSTIEYFKFNSVWKERFEGKDQAFYLGLWETKLSYPTNGIKRDGSVPLSAVYIHTSGGIVSKGDLDAAEAALSSSSHKFVAPDGSNPMIEGYSPQVDGDVITREYLESGQMLLIPPTTEPIEFGVIWNDNGVPKISNKTFILGTKIIPDFYYNTLMEFGRRVKTNGSKIIVSSRQYSPYVFDMDGSNSTVIFSPLETPDGELMGSFGIDTGIGINSSKIVIGGSYNRFDPDDGGTIFVYDHDLNLITSFLEPDVSNRWSGNGFGSHIEVGESIICSAQFIGYYGKMRIIDLEGNLINTFTTGHSESISEMSISSDKIAFGVTDSGTSGVVNILDHSGNLLTTIDGPSSGKAFGRHVAINTDYLVVSEFFSSSIRLYSSSGTFIMDLPNPGGQRTDALTLSDNYIYAGMPWTSTGGVVYVYTYSGVLVRTITPFDAHSGGNFGYSLDNIGDTLIVGAWRDTMIDNDGGAAYSYN